MFEAPYTPMIAPNLGSVKYIITFNIYIAAPDFNYINKDAINRIAECLKYHNFTPRLPVRENGQLTADATNTQRQEIYNADINLLQECQLVLAVMVFDDPGTIFEVGFAVGIQKPVLVYDPYHNVANPMLSQSANLVSPSLDEIIGLVFEIASRSFQQ